ncbi:MAG: ATP-grasp fold amidoligase family protein [Alphaproteobacteria bacterium]
MFDKLICAMVNVLIYLRHPRNIVRFRRVVGYFPNVAMPRRYNEKMLWRKVFDHNPRFVVFSDKLATKDLQAQLCPDLKRADILWVGKRAGDIPDGILANPVAIKANHGCGFNLLLPDGCTADELPADRVDDWLKTAFGRRDLEWAYQPVIRELFVEELLMARPGHPLVELSVHAVDGDALFIEVVVDNTGAARQKGYFRPDGTRWKAIEKQPIAGKPGASLADDFKIPQTFREALAHARVLGTGVDYARFDFFSLGDCLYGGEITVYPGAGLTRHDHFLTYNAYLSGHWDLLKSWFLSARQGWPTQIYANALRRRLTHNGTKTETGCPA